MKTEAFHFVTAPSYHSLEIAVFLRYWCFSTEQKQQNKDNTAVIHQNVYREIGLHPEIVFHLGEKIQ